MLKIRLSRVGKKNQPSFKIVVMEKSGPPKGGRFIEVVGSYNPLTKERFLRKDRIQYWLSRGAKPSETLHNLLVSEKILVGKKIPVHIRKPSKAAEAKKETLVAETPGTKKEKDVEEAPKEENSPVGGSEEEKVAEKTPEKEKLSSAKEKTEEKEKSE